MNKPIYILSILFLLFSISGCMKQINVTSNTFANHKMIPCGFSVGSSFYISSKVDDSNSLFLQEIEEKISQRLHSNGYVTTDAESAEYHLVYSCGVIASRENVNVPHFIPGSQQVKEGAGHSRASGSVYSGYDTARLSSSGSTHYHETTTNSGSIVYLPETITIFTHKIDIEVYRIKSFVVGRENELVWQGTAVSCESTGDQRDILDYLLDSIFKHFGTSTAKHAQASYTQWL